MKEHIATLRAEINELKKWIAEKAADPTTPMEEIDAKKAKMDDLIKRYEMLKEQHDELETKQRLDVAFQAGSSPEHDEKSVKIMAKAAFYKAALLGGDVQSASKALGGIPENSAELGFGDNLLPTSLSTELITEPVDENALRDIEPVSNITGLEEPIITFEIEDEDYESITDEETAKEIMASGGKISYGRFKTKLSATVKDTVMHGTLTNLVTTIENALRSALATKEKINAFRKKPHAKEGHMSFYLNEIKTVKGPDLIQAIINAWSDLPDYFSNRASVTMRKQDYYSAIRKLANNNADLWGKKPEDVIGIPVKFVDRAVVPVVGDFSFSRQNYDIGTIYETDKDARKGEYYFVVTAWGDHRIRLKSAFRLAEVDEPVSG